MSVYPLPACWIADSIAAADPGVPSGLICPFGPWAKAIGTNRNLAPRHEDCLPTLKGFDRLPISEAMLKIVRSKS